MEGRSAGRVATPFWGGRLAAVDNGAPRFERENRRGFPQGFTCTRSPDTQTPDGLHVLFVLSPESDRSSQNDGGRERGRQRWMFPAFPRLWLGASGAMERKGLTYRGKWQEGRKTADRRSECMVGRLTTVILDRSADLFIVHSHLKERLPASSEIYRDTYPPRRVHHTYKHFDGIYTRLYVLAIQH